jgi:hypothetical protein
MAQGIIFAYSYNKFHATLTTRAQNTISAPTCVPETRFCCLKICGWDSGQPFVKSPGSSNTRPPCTYMKGKFPTPVNCLSGKFPGVSQGGMVTPGIDSCITRPTHGIPIVRRVLNTLLFTVNHVLLSTVSLNYLRVGCSNLEKFHFMNL